MQHSKQGQSDATEFKERGLEAAFSINLKIFKDRMPGKTYWHFDLNSGGGMNEKVGCIGSPLAFIRAATAKEVEKFYAFFCDSDANQTATLMRRAEISSNKRCFTINGDNASLVEAIPSIIDAIDNPQYALGMVLSDPNGAQVPLNELAELSRVCPRLDMAIHWNARVRRLMRGRKWEFIDIDDAIAMLNKQHWLIRKPLGNHQWTVLIGRNFRVGDHKALGYYHLESREGQEILQKCKARLQPGYKPPPPFGGTQLGFL